MATHDQKTTELPTTTPAGELDAEQLGEEDLKDVSGGLISAGGDGGVCAPN